MNLICKNDVFVNAFVSTQASTEFLSMDIERTAAKAFDEFDKDIVENPKTKLKVQQEFQPDSQIEKF